jgi:hypothetical protein
MTTSEQKFLTLCSFEFYISSFSLLEMKTHRGRGNAPKRNDIPQQQPLMIPDNLLNPNQNPPCHHLYLPFLNPLKQISNKHNTNNSKWGSTGSPSLRFDNVFGEILRRTSRLCNLENDEQPEEN